MTKLSAWKTTCAIFLLGAATAISSPAQTFNTLAHFNGNDGANPDMALTQGVDGRFYGTTLYGGHICPGNEGCGTVFKITAKGTLTQLHRFVGTDGSFPMAGLVQATDGNFYGTTLHGGPTGDGTLFRITPAGALTTLHNFCPQDPVCTDGSVPATGLVQATNGNLYGTTTYGNGNNATGTVFKITLGGVLTTLHTFDLTDGAYPEGTLIQANDGNLYGTTYEGGSHRTCGLTFGCGTIFRITPGGVLTTLYSFCAQTTCVDGSGPQAGLVQATDGSFYGTTATGGAMEAGTVFQLTPEGTLTTLHSFCSQPDCPDGAGPDGGLVQATDGNFYGTTYFPGTVFSLSVGLGPFIKTLPAAGKLGAKVGILGNNLTGATSVTFNGAPTRFAVKSATLIVTQVPTGATTGPVIVTTPSGTLTSNVPFQVIP